MSVRTVSSMAPHLRTRPIPSPIHSASMVACLVNQSRFVAQFSCGLAVACAWGTRRGWHKLHSEQLAQAACPEAAVLRSRFSTDRLQSRSRNRLQVCKNQQRSCATARAQHAQPQAVTSLCSDLKSGIRRLAAVAEPRSLGRRLNALR